MYFINNICCLCLSEENELKSLFNDNKSVNNVIQHVLPNIPFYETAVPTYVCTSCFTNIEAAYAFQNECVKTYYKWREYVEKLRIKQEESYNDLKIFVYIKNDDDIDDNLFSSTTEQENFQIPEIEIKFSQDEEIPKSSEETLLFENISFEEHKVEACSDFETEYNQENIKEEISTSKDQIIIEDNEERDQSIKVQHEEYTKIEDVHPKIEENITPQKIEDTIVVLDDDEDDDCVFISVEKQTIINEVIKIDYEENSPIIEENIAEIDDCATIIEDENGFKIPVEDNLFENKILHYEENKILEDKDQIANKVGIEKTCDQIEESGTNEAILYEENVPRIEDGILFEDNQNEEIFEENSNRSEENCCSENVPMRKIQIEDKKEENLHVKSDKNEEISCKIIEDSTIIENINCEGIEERNDIVDRNRIEENIKVNRIEETCKIIEDAKKIEDIKKVDSKYEIVDKNKNEEINCQIIEDSTIIENINCEDIEERNDIVDRHRIEENLHEENIEVNKIEETCKIIEDTKKIEDIKKVDSKDEIVDKNKYEEMNCQIIEDSTIIENINCEDIEERNDIVYRHQNEENLHEEKNIKVNRIEETCKIIEDSTLIENICEEIEERNDIVNSHQIEENLRKEENIKVNKIEEICKIIKDSTSIAKKIEDINSEERKDEIVDKIKNEEIRHIEEKDINTQGINKKIRKRNKRIKGSSFEDILNEEKINEEDLADLIPCRTEEIDCLFLEDPILRENLIEDNHNEENKNEKENETNLISKIEDNQLPSKNEDNLKDKNEDNLEGKSEEMNVPILEKTGSDIIEDLTLIETHIDCHPIEDHFEENRSQKTEKTVSEHGKSQITTEEPETINEESQQSENNEEYYRLKRIEDFISQLQEQMLEFKENFREIDEDTIDNEEKKPVEENCDKMEHNEISNLENKEYKILEPVSEDKLVNEDCKNSNEEIVDVTIEKQISDLEKIILTTEVEPKKELQNEENIPRVKKNRKNLMHIEDNKDNLHEEILPRKVECVDIEENIKKYEIEQYVSSQADIVVQIKVIIQNEDNGNSQIKEISSEPSKDTIFPKNQNEAKETILLEDQHVPNDETKSKKILADRLKILETISEDHTYHKIIHQFVTPQITKNEEPNCAEQVQIYNEESQNIIEERIAEYDEHIAKIEEENKIESKIQTIGFELTENYENDMIFEKILKQYGITENEDPRVRKNNRILKFKIRKPSINQNKKMTSNTSITNKDLSNMNKIEMPKKQIEEKEKSEENFKITQVSNVPSITQILNKDYRNMNKIIKIPIAQIYDKSVDEENLKTAQSSNVSSITNISNNDNRNIHKFIKIPISKIKKICEENLKKTQISNVSSITKIGNNDYRIINKVIKIPKAQIEEKEKTVSEENLKTTSNVSSITKIGNNEHRIINKITKIPPAQIEEKEKSISEETLKKNQIPNVSSITKIGNNEYRIINKIVKIPTTQIEEKEKSISEETLKKKQIPNVSSITKIGNNDYMIKMIQIPKTRIEEKEENIIEEYLKKIRISNGLDIRKINKIIKISTAQMEEKSISEETLKKNQISNVSTITKIDKNDNGNVIKIPNTPIEEKEKSIIEDILKKNQLVNALSITKIGNNYNRNMKKIVKIPVAQMEDKEKSISEEQGEENLKLNQLPNVSSITKIGNNDNKNVNKIIKISNTQIEEKEKSISEDNLKTKQISNISSIKNIGNNDNRNIIKIIKLPNTRNEEKEKSVGEDHLKTNKISSITNISDNMNKIINRGNTQREEKDKTISEESLKTSQEENNSNYLLALRCLNLDQLQYIMSNKKHVLHKFIVEELMNISLNTNEEIASSSTTKKQIINLQTSEKTFVSNVKDNTEIKEIQKIVKNKTSEESTENSTKVSITHLDLQQIKKNILTKTLAENEAKTKTPEIEDKKEEIKKSVGKKRKSVKNILKVAKKLKCLETTHFEEVTGDAIYLEVLDSDQKNVAKRIEIKDNEILTSFPDCTNPNVSRQPTKMHRCLLCGHNYFNIKELKNHSMSHKIIKCKKCISENTKSDLFTFNELKIHVKYNHSPASNLYDKKTCTKCDIKFKTFKSYKKHFNSHKIKRKICKTCNASIPYVSYGRHLETVHRFDLQYECYLCAAKFNSMQNLRSHSETHTDINKCALCLKEFNKREDFIEHLKLCPDKKSRTKHPTSDVFNRKCMYRNRIKRKRFKIDNAYVTPNKRLKYTENTKTDDDSNKCDMLPTTSVPTSLVRKRKNLVLNTKKAESKSLSVDMNESLSHLNTQLCFNVTDFIEVVPPNSENDKT